MAKSEPRYRLVVFEEIDEPHAVRDLLGKVVGTHPTDAMQWVARAPGVWPQPLAERETRELLDGLYVLGVAAEAWRADQFPELGVPRHVHLGACLPEGFRIQGLRGEPTHWVPWEKIELVSAGRIKAEDEFRPPLTPPSLPNALAVAARALRLRGPAPRPRRSRALRIPRDPVGAVVIVRRDPRITFLILADQMNYAYLGDRLQTTTAANFPIFVADLCRQAPTACITDATRSFLDPEGDPDEHTFDSAQALLDYSTHRLLWSWYRRDRDSRSPNATDES